MSFTHLVYLMWNDMMIKFDLSLSDLEERQEAYPREVEETFLAGCLQYLLSTDIEYDFSCIMDGLDRKGVILSRFSKFWTRQT